jgi:acyl-CoA synthetase (AMP-forming)/AMP-acid ligase II
VPRGEPPDLTSLIAWAKHQELPKRSWPEDVRIVGEMPMTPAGKVKKQELKELLWP